MSCNSFLGHKRRWFSAHRGTEETLAPLRSVHFKMSPPGMQPVPSGGPGMEGEQHSKPGISLRELGPRARLHFRSAAPLPGGTHPACAWCEQTSQSHSILPLTFRSRQFDFAHLQMKKQRFGVKQFAQDPTANKTNRTEVFLVLFFTDMCYLIIKRMCYFQIQQ